MRLLPLLLFPLLSGCNDAVSQVPTVQVPAKAPGRYVETLVSGSATRKYILRVPKGYDGTKPYPIVMVLHGWTSSAEQAEQYTRMGDLADAEGFVAVFPDGLGNPGYQGWNAGFINLTGLNPGPDDVSFLTATLDKVEKEVSIDPDRQFVVGHSNGAFMTNYLGSKLSGRLAAIASMAGTVGLSEEKKIPLPSSPISVMLLHGKADRMVAYEVSATALLRPIGATDSAKFWAKADGIETSPTSVFNDDRTVETLKYSGGKNGTEVVLVSVQKGTHDWWGGLRRSETGISEVPTFGAPVATLVWNFFKTHPRQHSN